MPKPKGVHLWVILLILVLMVIAGTVYAVTRGGDESGTAIADAVRVEVMTDENAEPTVATLDCEDIDTARVCEALTDDLLAPVAADQACTMIFGGPETATITGTLRGKRVDAEFSRSDGCEIARWDRLVTALKPAGIKGLA